MEQAKLDAAAVAGCAEEAEAMILKEKKAEVEEEDEEVRGSWDDNFLKGV